jgi:branched-chain amino acid transport system permease protein
MSYILAQCFINWIMISSIYLLMALGLTIIFSVMGVLNFAHGALYMLGGYVIYYAVSKLGLSIYLGLILAPLLIGSLGILIYRGLLRYFRTDLLACLIITVGLANLIENGSYIFFGPFEKHVPSFTDKIIRFMEVSLSLERLIIMFIAIGLTLALLFLIRFSKLGRSLRAVAEDADAAALQGVKVEKVFILGMFISCGLAGIAGALMAFLFAVGPFVGQAPLMNAFIVIIVGGMGSILGAMISAFILGLIVSLGGTFISGEVATLICFALLLLILVVRPRGLLGEE